MTPRLVAYPLIETYLVTGGRLLYVTVPSGSEGETGLSLSILELLLLYDTRCSLDPN